MANLKLIGYRGHRIEPDEEGYTMDGETFATLGGAVKRAREMDQEREDNKLAGMVQREEDTDFMSSERSMRAVVFIGAILMAWMLTGCQVNERPRVVAMPPEVASELSPIAFLVIMAGACAIAAAVAYSLGRTYESRQKQRNWKARAYPSVSTKRD